LLAPVRLPPDPRVLVNSTTADDAGVVLLRDDLALVQTVDFFPPMVDDPVWFGRVGAANSLSDVYAMGADPVSAVSVLALPEELPESVPSDILNGAIEVCTQAGAALVGGHTIRDAEVKFGLAVTGTVRPDEIVTNAGARPGDALVLTKPLGSGFLCSAIKADALDADQTLRLMHLLAGLNRDAAAAMREVGVHAATDVTGYGLLGHALSMAEASGVTFRLEAAAAPWIPGLEPFLDKRYTCGGLNRNLAWADADGRTRWRGGTDAQRQVLADPQTSGGLLLVVAPDRLDALLEALARHGVQTRAVVGDVVAREDWSVEVV
jgi:selenide, water dikinase